jgi:hypothetical protein
MSSLFQCRFQATQAVVAPEDEINLLQCLPFCRPPYVHSFRLEVSLLRASGPPLSVLVLFFFFQGPLLYRDELVFVLKEKNSCNNLFCLR